MIFLNNLEIMEQEAADRGIEVIDYYFESDRIKALCKLFSRKFDYLFDTEEE